MKHIKIKYVLMAGLAVAGWLCNGEIWPTSPGGLVATAEAIIGRPMTPVSYAGVARRTTVRVATPGVRYGVNLGGPVNRVGIR